MQDTRISILIVEDEAHVRSLLNEILSPRFYCAGAESASEALTQMESRFFHVALIDVELPGMSGICLCRLIANRCPNTAVVVVSGNTDSQSVAEAIKAGAVGYISKPFNVSDVVATVEKALKRRLPDAVA